MAGGEFRFYILGLVLVSIGTGVFMCGVFQDQLIPALAGLLFMLWGGALVESVTWQEVREYMRALFHRSI